MPKKIIQKSFSKIIFLIFIFTIFSTFINKQKTNAFSVDTNTCAFTSTSSTSTVVSTADLTGTLPLCFYDVNNGDRLTLFKDNVRDTNNTICFSNTKTGDN